MNLYYPAGPGAVLTGNPQLVEKPSPAYVTGPPARPVGPGLISAYPQPAGAVPHGAVQHGAVTHGAVQHGAVTHGAVQHGAVQHGAVQHGAVQHGVLPHGAQLVRPAVPVYNGATSSAPVPYPASVYHGNALYSVPTTAMYNGTPQMVVPTANNAHHHAATPQVQLPSHTQHSANHLAGSQSMPGIVANHMPAVQSVNHVPASPTIPGIAANHVPASPTIPRIAANHVPASPTIPGIAANHVAYTPGPPRYQYGGAHIMTSGPPPATTAGLPPSPVYPAQVTGPPAFYRGPSVVPAQRVAVYQQPRAPAAVPAYHQPRPAPQPLMAQTPAFTPARQQYIRPLM